MAVVKMKKIRLIGLSSEKEKIISGLLRSGATELKPTEEIDLTVRGVNAAELDSAATRYSKLVIALDFLKVQEGELKKLVAAKKYGKEKLPVSSGGLFSVRESVSADEFEAITLKSDELFNVCGKLEDIAFRKNEIKSELTSLTTLKSGLTPYKDFSMKFSAVKSTKHVSFLLGSVKSGKTVEREAKELSEKYGADTTLTPVYGVNGKVQSYVFFSAVEGEKKSELEQELSSLGYTPCPYTFDMTAKEKLEEIEKELTSLNDESERLVLDAVSYGEYKSRLELLCDHFRFRMEMAKVEGDFARTDETFVLEGFVPECEVERVEQSVLKRTENYVLDVEDVGESDKAPTLLKNNKVVAPYESITSVYSPPSYKESDPNPAVAIFYFIFFGIMLGDAGYGIILALACFFATRFMKMEKGTKNLLTIFMMGGISAIVWGILFGGIFSIEGVQPILFAPMSDPVSMLVLCFALGLIQIFVGMGYQAHDFIKNGHLDDAVYDIFSWYTIFLGAGLAVLPMLVEVPMPATIGLVILAVGIAVLMFGGAIRSKGIVGRVIGAVKPLYGIIGFFSDVMSYSRLFGLCLASGVIGLVFNTLGGLVFGIPVIGWLFAVIIFLIGHTLNFAIGLLGIYVHDSRLQYIEFFGRFYHGGGRTFSPMGLNLKYVTIKQEV